MAAAAPHPTKIFRRNTSGIIGLRKEAEAKTAEDSLGGSKPFLVQSNSSNVSPATLEIRETAARRISAHQPPVLEDLQMPDTLTVSPITKVRKTSEIVRPNFSIYEERESQGMFVSGILNERSDGCGSNAHNVTFSFMQEDRTHDLADDFSSIDLNEDSSSGEEDRMSTGSSSDNNSNGNNASSAPPKFSFVGRFDLHGRRDSSEDIMHHGFVPRF